MYKKNIYGFTLVELASVLVIIGLIIGGLYVGQKLLRAAEVRMIMSRLESYDSAIAAFRTKYKYLPGDIPGKIAHGYGLPADLAVGDGDNRITDMDADVDDPRKWRGEITWVWPQLSEEQFVSGGPYDNSLQLGQGIPKLIDGSGIIVDGERFARNAYIVSSFTPQINSEYDIIPTLYAEAAFALDMKRDDGKPMLGDLVARGVFLSQLHSPLPDNPDLYDVLFYSLTATIQAILDALPTLMFSDGEVFLLPEYQGTACVSLLGTSYTAANLEITPDNAAEIQEMMNNAVYYIVNDKSLCGLAIAISQ